ncbi:MAG TPA: exodeoxyribonuclease VII large subunit [Casimicrobiaceae bacterium]
MKTVRDEVPFVEVVVIETRVQGVGAEIDIAAALDEASRYDVDAIVLARGGGKYEDRFPFNLEPVARAIVRARLPVLTAIGHEPDHHLADDVADRSFGTPSKAAEFIAKGWLVARRRLQVGQRDLGRAARDLVLRGFQRFEDGRSNIERAGLRVVTVKRAALADRIARLERHNPQRKLAEDRGRFAQRNGRLDTAAARLVSRKAHASGETRAALERAVTALATGVARRFERSEAALERCDPLAPLSRGYAIVTKDGTAVRDAAALRGGDVIAARLQRGMLSARVESVYDDG